MNIHRKQQEDSKTSSITKGDKGGHLLPITIYKMSNAKQLLP